MSTPGNSIFYTITKSHPTSLDTKWPYRVCQDFDEDRNVIEINATKHLSITSDPLKGFGSGPDGKKFTRKLGVSWYSDILALLNRGVLDNIYFVRNQQRFYLAGTQFFNENGDLVCLGFEFDDSSHKWIVTYDFPADQAEGKLLFAPY